MDHQTPRQYEEKRIKYIFPEDIFWPIFGILEITFWDIFSIFVLNWQELYISQLCYGQEDKIGISRILNFLG